VPHLKLPEKFKKEAEINDFSLFSLAGAEGLEPSARGFGVDA